MAPSASSKKRTAPSCPRNGAAAAPDIPVDHPPDAAAAAAAAAASKSSKAPTQHAVRGSVTLGNRSFRVAAASPSTYSFADAADSGGRPGVWETTRNVQRLSPSGASRDAASDFAAPEAPGENVLSSTPLGLNSAATPSPEAVRIAKSATRRAPSAGNASTRIHAANVYPPRPEGHAGGRRSDNEPAPDDELAPSSPARSKYAAGPSRRAAAPRVRSKRRRLSTPTEASRRIRNDVRKCRAERECAAHSSTHDANRSRRDELSVFSGFFSSACSSSGSFEALNSSSEATATAANQSRSAPRRSA